ncbi:TrbI/VirB10 family protein [Legionella lytica]|uniref:TrbI/VirB10 family protein n=1 Tax=Legionella lytica TaxID=96232 RepID=A0ABW8DDS8_9GAMM
MNNHSKPDHDAETQLSDEPILKDAPAPKKWPWLIAAVVIVVIVMSLQWGTRLLMNHVTHKKQANTTAFTDDTNPTFKALPLPVTEKPRVASVPRPKKRRIEPPQISQVDPDDELRRARLIARLQEHKKMRDEEEEMIQSSAVLNIGVGAHPTPTQSQSPANGPSEGINPNPNVAFLRSVSNQPVDEVNAGLFGDLRFRIRKGKILRGVTESAIDSDLPGMIRGHVTEDVYGDQGEINLIPNGTGLIGEYRSGELRNGQVTLYVVWTRLQLSNGIYVTLDSPGSDPLGRAGMTGPVNHHYLQRYGSSLLTSIVSAGAATWGVSSNDRYNSEAAYRQGVSASLSQTASRELQQNASIQNTILPPQGTEISIMVNKDISFEDVLTNQEG